MATRYGLTGTVAATTAAIVAVLVAMSGSERAQSLGLTQHNALITAQDAGAADAVAAVAVSPGTAGQVLTVSDAGLPHWAAAGGGGVHGSGTLAARPASPAAGDTYAITSGTASGDRYACHVAGAWTLVAYDRVRLDETPYLWWRLDEASGNAINSGSASSADLAATSIAARNIAFSSLSVRGTLFDGSSRFVGATGATALSTAWTLAAWVQNQGIYQGYRTVVGLDTTTGSFSQPYASAALALDNAGVRAWITTTAQPSTGQEVTATQPSLLDLHPHHLVARFTGTALQVVIDGVQRASLTTTGGTMQVGPSPQWGIGANDGNERWVGLISDVRVYAESKSDSWCLETWQRGVGAYTGQP